MVKIDKGNGKGKKRECREYEQEFLSAMYESKEGWRGIPAASFRNAMISACRVVGFPMTRAKLSVFIIADGEDKDDGTPLVKIHGEPRKVSHPVRNADRSVDIRIRAMWDSWSANVKIHYDADQFSQAGIANLLMRVGIQVGIGEGRPDGKNSAGMGWGTFEIKEK